MHSRIGLNVFFRFFVPHRFTSRKSPLAAFLGTMRAFSSEPWCQEISPQGSETQQFRAQILLNLSVNYQRDKKETYSMTEFPKDPAIAAEILAALKTKDEDETICRYPTCHELRVAPIGSGRPSAYCQNPDHTAVTNHRARQQLRAIAQGVTKDVAASPRQSPPPGIAEVSSLRGSVLDRMAQLQKEMERYVTALKEMADPDLSAAQIQAALDLADVRVAEAQQSASAERSLRLAADTARLAAQEEARTEREAAELAIQHMEEAEARSQRLIIETERQIAEIQTERDETVERIRAEMERKIEEIKTQAKQAIEEAQARQDEAEEEARQANARANTAESSARAQTVTSERLVAEARATLERERAEVDRLRAELAATITEARTTLERERTESRTTLERDRTESRATLDRERAEVDRLRAELERARTQAEQANTRADRLATQNDELRSQLVQRPAGGGASQQS
jgi:colicin import membrane protein